MEMSQFEKLFSHLYLVSLTLYRNIFRVCFTFFNTAKQTKHEKIWFENVIDYLRNLWDTKKPNKIFAVFERSCLWILFDQILYMAHSISYLLLKNTTALNLFSSFTHKKN